MRSIFLILFYAATLFAQEPSLDELNCSPSEETGEFNCKNSGTSVAPPNVEETPADKPRSLQILAWNFSTIGTSRLEYDRLVQILSDADISILQEVEFNGTGESGLTAISRLLGARMKERICKGWFKSMTGDRARHAFIWRDKTISFVEKSGEVKERCPDAPTVMRVDGDKLGANELFSATFMFKPKKQIFTLATLHWDKKPKKGADKEVTKVFSRLDSNPWPLVLSADFKMLGSDRAFKDSRKFEFKTALPKVTEHNMWLKNMNMIRSGVVDFKERFPELSEEERAQIASAPPIGVEISFSAEEADVLKLQLTKKQPARDKASVKPARKVRLMKDLRPLDLNDDLEGEASVTENH